VAPAIREARATLVPLETLAGEAARALRIEHWQDGVHQSLTGLDALRHSVGESPARHWVDLVDPSPALISAVAHELGLHPLVAEDIEERNQRPKLEMTDGHVHIVAFALRLADEIETEEIDIVLGQTFLLTVHTAAWNPAAADHLREGVAPVLERGIDYLTWALLDEIVDGYFPVFDRIEDEIDELEDRIINDPGRETLERLFSLKSQLVQIRHVMAPQREIFNQLTNRTLPMISPEHVLYFRDVYDHAVHLSEEYDSFRDLVSGALDVYLSTVNNNLSLIMKRLTGITVVLAGIGAFAGIFGMSEAGAAFAGGEAIGFWLVTVSIIGGSLLLLAALRRMRWL
jgi:magnesium transporter